LPQARDQPETTSHTKPSVMEGTDRHMGMDVANKRVGASEREDPCNHFQHYSFLDWWPSPQREGYLAIAELLTALRPVFVSSKFQFPAFLGTALLTAASFPASEQGHAYKGYTDEGT